MTQKSTEFDAVPSAGKTLLPVRGAAWGALFGTPLAAGIVLAINFARLGRKRGMWIALGGGLLATIAVGVVFQLRPKNSEFPSPLKIHLCDASFAVRKTIEIEAEPPSEAIKEAPE